MTSWLKALDRARLAEKAGIALSDREVLAAAQDFEAEAGHDDVVRMPRLRLERAFIAYLGKWARRAQRNNPPPNP